MYSGNSTSNEGRRTRKDTMQEYTDYHWYGMVSVQEGLDKSGVFRLEETTEGKHYRDQYDCEGQEESPQKTVIRYFS